MNRLRSVPLLSGLLFFLLGLALIPFPGLQNDEIFFSGPIYPADSAYYSLAAGTVKIPVMVMSYSGAFKTWLYQLLLTFLAPTIWTVRIPVLLIGMGTIFLTWIWVRRIAGERAAQVSVVLLATDTIFLMTNTFDWGPVAIQHLLLMAGLAALQKWMETKSNALLAGGFFLFGLGMWDKALMAWPLIALAVAVVCVFPRELVRHLRPRAMGTATLAFLLGAAPLLWYNVARPGETAKQNAKFSLQEVPTKLIALRQTIDGSTLSGYMVYEDKVTGKREPVRLEQKIPVAIRRFLGSHRTNWMLPAWALGFVCAVFLLRTPAGKPLIFLLVTTTVIWLQMAITKGTGGASHHVILMWPFPCVFLGIAFSSMADRIPVWGPRLLVAVVAFLALENVLTTNDYLARFIVNGPAGGWTDAIQPLARTLDRKSASWFGLVDWGYLNGIRMFRPEEMPLFIVDIGADQKEFERQIGSADFLFVQHTDDKQIFPGVNTRLRKRALEAGYVEKIERTVPDRNGRPVFELFRFQKSASMPASTPAAE